MKAIIDARQIAMIAAVVLSIDGGLMSQSAKLISFRKSGDEQAYVDKDGKCFELRNGQAVQVECCEMYVKFGVSYLCSRGQ